MDKNNAADAHPSSSNGAVAPPGSLQGSAMHTRRLRERGYRILICLDRSPFSESCLPHALSLAKTFSAGITLVHVMAPHDPAHAQGTDALSWELARQEARVYLEKMQQAAELTLSRPVEIRLEQGRPAERIVSLSRELNADLTVLGSHGEGGGAARDLGGTAAQILAGARNSVFVAHAASPSANIVQPKRILVPLDGSLRTESALPPAARIASACGAELLLVHVVAEPVPNSVLRVGEDLELARQLAQRLELAAKKYLGRLRDQLASEVATVRTLVVRHASERQCLLDLAQNEQVDLIVLSAHGAACDPARAFGGVAVDLLTRLAVPLLALQDLPERDLPRARIGDEALAAPPRGRSAPEGA